MKKVTMILIFVIILSALPVEAGFSLKYQLDKHKENIGYNLQIDRRLLSIPEFHVRGIYVTGWVAGTRERMDKLIDFVSDSVLNSMVIDIKDELGYLSYNSEVELAREIGANRNKVRDIEGLLQELNNRGIYTIGRIVVFKDAILARGKKELALTLENSDTDESTKSRDWVNPSDREVWEYNVEIAKEALKLGFNEIQIDYIRYPALAASPWNAVLENKMTQSKIIGEFLKYMKLQLAEYNRPLSIDVFGLTTSVDNDLGIGQNFNELATIVDIISPMLYPSHYSNGVFGINVPESEPYRVVYRSLEDAIRKIGNTKKTTIRPWLQDFSLQHGYSSKEVREQLKAAEKLGIKEWLFWNPRSRYTEEFFLNFSLDDDGYL